VNIHRYPRMFLDPKHNTHPTVYPKKTQYFNIQRKTMDDDDDPRKKKQDSQQSLNWLNYKMQPYSPFPSSLKIPPVFLRRSTGAFGGLRRVRIPRLDRVVIDYSSKLRRDFVSSTRFTSCVSNRCSLGSTGNRVGNVDDRYRITMNGIVA
jgi:hypothetical protein